MLDKRLFPRPKSVHTNICNTICYTTQRFILYNHGDTGLKTACLATQLNATQ